MFIHDVNWYHQSISLYLCIDILIFLKCFSLLLTGFDAEFET